MISGSRLESARIREQARTKKTSDWILDFWRGRSIRQDVLQEANAFGPMHGDEVFTEELLAALTRLDERALLLKITDRVSGDFAIAAALADYDRKARIVTVETAAHLDRADIHHELLRKLLTLESKPIRLRWRPPSTEPLEQFPMPSGAIRERTIIEMHATLPLPRPNTAPSMFSSGEALVDTTRSAQEVPDPACRLENESGEGLDAQQRWAQPAQHGVTGYSYRSYADCVAGTSQSKAFLDSVIRINNHAFADHPEQRSLDKTSFGLRVQARWFDPAGLVVASHDGLDVGFVWMKCDHPRPAELYVVAVEPNAVIRGLGRSLVLRGFDHAVAAHGATAGMLFVDAANSRAAGLYESLGFHATQRQDVVLINRMGF